MGIKKGHLLGHPLVLVIGWVIIPNVHHQAYR